MARKTRVEYENACYHVIARGNQRARIFRTALDYELFLNSLSEAVPRFRVLVMSYCLMPNHYHLAIRTPEGNLSRMMAWFQTTFTARYRARYKLCGHVFSGRYKAQLVEDNDYLRTLLLYIHLNPIRSRKSGKLQFNGKYADLLAYPWNSHLNYLGKKKQDWFDQSGLKFWGGQWTKASRLYEEEVKSLIKKEPEDWHHKVQLGLAAGSERFIEKLKTQLKQKKKIGKETGLKEINHLRSEEIKKRLKPELARLSDQRIRIWARVRLIGERPVDLAREFKYRDGGSILQIVKRTEKRAKVDDLTRKKVRRLERIVSSVDY
ncbi:MAG: transposase [Verrucomicrobiota bacterium]